MAEASRPNFFILLDLDPAQPWSEQTFVETLDRKRAEWTKGGKNPKNRAKYAGYMELVPRIRALMSDPEKRRQEADDALQQGAAALQEWRKKLRDSIDLIASKGYVTEDEVMVVAKDYVCHFTEAEVRAELKQRGTEIKAISTKSEAAGDYLDSSRFNRIKASLEVVCKQDLYDFLGATLQTRTGDLRKRAKDIYTSPFKV